MSNVLYLQFSKSEDSPRSLRRRKFYQLHGEVGADEPPDGGTEYGRLVLGVASGAAYRAAYAIDQASLVNIHHGAYDATAMLAVIGARRRSCPGHAYVSQTAGPPRPRIDADILTLGGADLEAARPEGCAEGYVDGIARRERPPTADNPPAD